MSDRDERARRFDALYRDEPDPWRVSSSEYERAKYEATLSALGSWRFSSVLEAGCGIGVLSRRLALRADRLLGIDVSEVALASARRLNGDLAHVEFARAEIPRQWPAPGRGTAYDLVVLSEILYFLDAGEVVEMATLCVRDVAPGGACLLVNWTGPCDLALDGDAAADLFIQAAGRTFSVESSSCKDYRLDFLRRR